LIGSKQSAELDTDLKKKNNTLTQDLHTLNEELEQLTKLKKHPIKKTDFILLIKKHAPDNKNIFSCILYIDSQSKQVKENQYYIIKIKSAEVSQSILDEVLQNVTSQS
jgi:hypothetical protein